MPEGNLSAIHYVQTWLARTENWIYWLISSFPDTVSSQIVCERREHPQEFILPEIHSLSDEPMYRQIVDRVLRKLGFRTYLAFLVRKADESGAKVLHSHFGHIGWANIGAASAAHLKHVVTFYGTDVSRLPRIDPRWRSRYIELFSAADRVLCEGPFMAGELVDLGCPSTAVQIHRIGVPVGDIAFAPRTWDRKEPLKILMAASFQEKKGIPDAIRALSLLRSHVPALRITLIGDATREARSRREKRSILAALRDTGLLGSTRLLGYQPWSVLLEQAYGHHMFLAPSRTAVDGDTEGGAPVGILGMLATGMPVVSTRHCDIPSIVSHGETGLLANEGDVNELAGHLIHLVDHPEDWMRLGAAGRSYVEREHDSRKQAAKLAELYRRL